jgi:hypothetical protein
VTVFVAKALGLVVTAVLRGNLDLCRVSIIACKKCTSISENSEVSNCRLSEGCQGPLPLWGLPSYLLQPGVCSRSIKKPLLARGGPSPRSSKASSSFDDSKGLCESKII